MYVGLYRIVWHKTPKEQNKTHKTHHQTYQTYQTYQLSIYVMVAHQRQPTAYSCLPVFPATYSCSPGFPTTYYLWLSRRCLQTIHAKKYSMFARSVNRLSKNASPMTSGSSRARYASTIAKIASRATTRWMGPTSTCGGRISSSSGATYAS